MSIVMDNCCVCEEPVGCSIIQVMAQARLYGWSANRFSARHYGGEIESGYTATPGPDYDAWNVFINDAFSTATLHPAGAYFGQIYVSSVGPITSPPGIGQGEDPGCPISRNFTTFVQSYTGAVWYDLGLGDGPQWYSATHDFIYTVDTETGIMILFDYSNTCGEGYHWVLDLNSGDLTTSGTQKTLFEGGGYLSTACPVSGAGYEMLAPSAVHNGLALVPSDIALPGGGGYYITSTSYDTNDTGWTISYDVFVYDGIGGEQHTTMMLSAAANFQDDDAAAGYTWDVALARARTMADFVHLDNVNHEYSADQGIYDATGAYVGNKIKQGKSYRVEYSTRFALEQGAPLFGAGFSYQFGDMYIYPQRLVIIEIGDTSDTGYAELTLDNCDLTAICRRFRVGVLGDNYATMTHQTMPIESQLRFDGTPGGDPSTDGQCATTEADTDCLHPFRATGNHIVEPEDSTFANGRLTMSLMVYPHTDEDGNKVCTYDTEIIEGVPTPTWPPTAPC